MTNDAAPIPKTRPSLRASNGRAASSTLSEVDAAPLAAKPEPIHSQRESPVTLSADMITTLSALSFSSQSSAMLKALVEEAQATFTVVFGPLMPTCCANCECPILSTWNKNLLSNLPSPSSPFTLAWSNALERPGKQDAKITPVLSL